jgi:hypothetical protein
MSATLSGGRSGCDRGKANTTIYLPERILNSTMTDLILYQFSRDLVEAGDAKDFLSRFGESSLPTGKKLEGMMNSLALMIEGYDHDPREIYAIPEVRKFYQQLWQRWPYWLFFCNLDTENLMMMVMCCLDSLDALKVQGVEQVKVSFNPLDVVRFISGGFVPMNEMCEQAGFSERQIYDRTKTVFEYFNLPFDGGPLPK